MKKLLSVLCLAVLSTAASAQVTVGNYDSGNCYPFSCFASDGGTQYVQQYRAGAFSGPMSFDTLCFYQDSAGLMDGATYSVYFSTSATAFGAMDGTLDNNIGSDNMLFGTFSLSGPMPEVLTLCGNTFNYNPMNGDLLMNVVVNSLDDPHVYESFFQADYTGDDVLRGYTNISGTNVNDNGALRTTFKTTNWQSPVPEPGTMALLLGAGVSGVLAVRRRK